MEIEDVNDFIDEKGKTKCDIFNNKGALLVNKGKIPPEKIGFMLVYTYVSEYNEFSKPVYEKKDIVNENNDIEKKKENLINKVGNNTYKTFDEVTSTVKNVLSKPAFKENDLSNIKELIDDTYKKNHVDLHYCIRTLRTSDTYTYNHSISVYLIFIQAMKDFKKYINNDLFWNVFKRSYAHINFNPENIKKYGIGALLHDIGKAMIPEAILKKKTSLIDKEFEIMKQHPSIGANILKKVNVTDLNILEIVGNHHSKYLTFKQYGQSALSQICNIIDIYDACRSIRSYKKAFDLEKTLEILHDESDIAKWHPFIFNIIINNTIPKFEKNS